MTLIYGLTLLHPLLSFPSHRPPPAPNIIRRITNYSHGSLWHSHVQRVQDNIWILLWSVVFARPAHANRLLAARRHCGGLRHELPPPTGDVHAVRLGRAAAVGGDLIVDPHGLPGDGGHSGRGGSLRFRVHSALLLMCFNRVSPTLLLLLRSAQRRRISPVRPCQVQQTGCP